MVPRPQDAEKVSLPFLSIVVMKRARTLLGAPGLTTKSKKLLGPAGIASSAIPEDSSDSEDHDLPPWDAELTKRPKRALRRNLDQPVIVSESQKSSCRMHFQPFLHVAASQS